MPCSEGDKQEFFLGKGGVVGLLPALVGSSDSTMGPAYAELNALGRGPTIVTLPASVMAQIREHATKGRAEFQQLELDMFRLAAVYLVEGMQQEVMDAATMFFLEFGLVRDRHAFAKGNVNKCCLCPVLLRRRHGLGAFCTLQWNSLNPYLNHENAVRLHLVNKSVNDDPLLFLCGQPLLSSEESMDQGKGVQGFLNLRKSHLSAALLDEVRLSMQGHLECHPHV